MHGGASTGPRTPEGRKRLAELGRARYVAAALAEGWILPSLGLRAVVAAIKRKTGWSHQTIGSALGVGRHDVRRVLAGLPGRPDELRQIESVLAGRTP